MYYRRDLEEPLKKALKQFPSVLITGPRQAGKSTLLQHCLKDYHYVNLDGAVERSMAREDPELFLDMHPAPVIIDEIQYAPDLLSAIKIRIDKDRQAKGRYVLTGSQIFQLMEGVTESLAGRIGIFHLYPFNMRETVHAHPNLDLMDPMAASNQVVRGFYPELIQDPSIDAAQWYESYITTYLERDVRNIRNIADLSLFERFIELLCTRVGSLLNLSEISKECGITHPTARSWISILDSTYTIYLLRPYFKNRSKRLVKSPKLYFVDTGLLCALLGIDSGERFLKASERGQLFENMVVMEWLKRESLRTSRPRLYFYRDAKGHEVDLLIERGDQLLAFEIKQTKSLTQKMVSPLERFLGDHPDATGRLLSLREEPIHLSRKVEAIHWSDSYTLF